MKICILTQPLGSNYGGVLQNYALQTVLKKLGNEVWTENRISRISHLQILLEQIKRNKIIRQIFLKDPLDKTSLSRTDEIKLSNIINKNLLSFVNNKLQTTSPIYNSDKKKIKKYNFDTYIVGSDQVWRPDFSPNIYNYFLDFTKDLNVKRIAYAASFGVDNWKFSKKETKKCRLLINKFDAVSVREDSAIKLCQEYFNKKATHLIDPTLLLEKEDYLKLIPSKESSFSKSQALIYVLDQTEQKKAIIKKVCSKYSLTEYNFMPTHKYREENINLNDCILKPIPEWLQAFAESEYIITDSFHGTIFSIIFNKPFISIANKLRGNTRFTSLLKQFKLEDRLIYSFDDLTDDLLNKPINFEKVNEKKKELQKIALTFLTEVGLQN